MRPITAAPVRSPNLAHSAAQGVCYLSDRSYSRMGAVPAWYLTLRNWLTPLAMVSTLSTVMYLVSKDVEKVGEMT